MLSTPFSERPGGRGPGATFGRKATKIRPKLQSRLKFPIKTASLMCIVRSPFFWLIRRRARDGRGTWFPALGGRFRAWVRGMLPTQLKNWTLAKTNVPPGACRSSHRPPSPATNAQDLGHGCLHNPLDFKHGRGVASDPQHNRTCLYNIEPRLDSARPTAFFVPQHDRDK